MPTVTVAQFDNPKAYIFIDERQTVSRHFRLVGPVDIEAGFGKKAVAVFFGIGLNEKGPKAIVAAVEMPACVIMAIGGWLKGAVDVLVHQGLGYFALSC